MRETSKPSLTKGEDAFARRIKGHAWPCTPEKYSREHGGGTGRREYEMSAMSKLPHVNAQLYARGRITV